MSEHKEIPKIGNLNDDKRLAEGDLREAIAVNNSLTTKEKNMLLGIADKIETAKPASIKRIPAKEIIESLQQA